jgi:hypothetical protein
MGRGGPAARPRIPADRAPQRRSVDPSRFRLPRAMPARRGGRRRTIRCRRPGTTNAAGVQPHRGWREWDRPLRRTTSMGRSIATVARSASSPLPSILCGIRHVPGASGCCPESRPIEADRGDADTSSTRLRSSVERHRRAAPGVAYVLPRAPARNLVQSPPELVSLGSSKPSTCCLVLPSATWTVDPLVTCAALPGRRSGSGDPPGRCRDRRDSRPAVLEPAVLPRVLPAGAPTRRGGCVAPRTRPRLSGLPRRSLFVGSGLFLR